MKASWTPLSVQLHNALIVSIFDTSRKKVLAKPVVDAPKKPPRKRRRLLPYQGPDEADAASLTSERLKKWTVGLGKRERERVQALEAGFGPPLEWPQPKQDEIARERGVVRLSERGGTWLRQEFSRWLTVPQNQPEVGLPYIWDPSMRRFLRSSSYRNA
jgi:hypothetical protein